MPHTRYFPWMEEISYSTRRKLEEMSEAAYGRIFLIRQLGWVALNAIIGGIAALLGPSGLFCVLIYFAVTTPHLYHFRCRREVTRRDYERGTAQHPWDTLSGIEVEMKFHWRRVLCRTIGLCVGIALAFYLA